MDTDLTERVIAVIARSRRIPVAAIAVESTFDDLNLQSLERIELLFALEDEFDIEIPDGDADGITDVRGIVERLGRLLAR